MPPSRKASTGTSGESAARRGSAARQPAATQPAPTGARPGSPAAAVMKQFQKTKNESTGRS